MDFNNYQEHCKRMVANFYNSRTDHKVEPKDVYVVWYCKTLGNAKALLSTDIPDGRYFEVTYNGVKNEVYLDSYVKEYNEAISMEGVE